MKRILLLALALILALLCFACGKRDGEKENNAPETEDASANAKIIGWMTYGYDKIVANVDPKAEEGNTFTIYLAKGETEGAQACVYSDTELKGNTFVLVSGNTEVITPTFYTTERTHTIRRRDWPDSLIPDRGKTVDIEAEQVLTFYVDFATTKDTPAGDYEFVYDLKNKNGKTLKTFTFKLHVWDFALPEDKTFATSFGINSTHAARFQSYYQQYYDSLLKHGISGTSLPFDILDEKADAYMSDPRVTSFAVPCHSEITDDMLLKYYEKLKSNPVWFEKAYFYPIDEPSDMAQLNEYKAHVERLNRLCPGIGVIAPYYKNIDVGGRKDQTTFMDECGTTLWCPKLNFWDDKNVYNTSDGNSPNYTGESFADRMKAMQESGDIVWTYVCNDPIDPYAQLFIDTEGVNQRAMFWQIYQRDCTGFLYWGTTAWGYRDYKNIDPWQTSYNGVGDGNGSPVYGEGFLFYPGVKLGWHLPVESIRLKIVRDGVEDIEMFYLAEEVLGKDWLVNKSMEVTDSLTTYCDDATFDKVRIEIGNALEAALAGK